MDAPLQLALSLESTHHNQYLFSDHYLNHLLPNDPRWTEALPEAESFLAWLQELHAKEATQLPEYNEAQLEEHWFKPILTRLDHVFERQASMPGLEAGVKRPDYVFFPDELTRQAAVSAQKTEAYTAQALAVGEVKRWDVPLGKKQKGGGPSFETQSPSVQIDYYVRIAGLDWGILSNGRRWRLVHRDTSYRLSIYYEVDLVDLLGRDDAAQAIRYFVLFFRQAAFRPDPQGRIFVEDALAASNAYAVALEEDLRKNVYQALESLMQGFLDLPANDLGPEDLRQVYDNSLYLLYRLLFILYGESRSLLPLQNDQYRTNYSLMRIKEDIAKLQVQPASRTTLFWSRLQNLFHIINGDDPELNRFLGVPRYNGRLFDPQLHPFLEEKVVGDRALVKAIDLLSRRVTDTGHEFVDYRTLSVRHLGSIYEGLLEYQPRYAAELMLAVMDSKGERWVKAQDAPKKARVIEHREAGKVYLETDKGERKATGSYYTPQYIVEYIVTHTLGPLVDEAIERVKAQAKAAGSKAARVQAEQSLADEVLSLKVLDPAMGSGHFLVEATEFLALALATDPYVETEELTEEDLTYWKRQVVERCIYGVDKNPLAVELAKLSLWLATVAADKPLSFLDHHLRYGDSLIGARVADLGEAPADVLNKKKTKGKTQTRQINMFGYLLSQQLPVMMGKVLEITQVESDSYETVQAKEAADQAVRGLKVPFEAVANLWVSAYFGNDYAAKDYEQALGLTVQPDHLLALPAVERAQEIAKGRRFFHWELAFPEAFYDQHGRSLGEEAGFDAVVGNPPYGFISDKFIQAALSWQYMALSNYDLYVAFIERGLEMLAGRGLLGYIAPTSWQTAIAYQDFRALVLRTCHIQRIINLPYDVFSDAYIDTSIYILRKERNLAETKEFLDRFVLVYEFQKRDKAEGKLHAGLEYEKFATKDWFGDEQLRFVMNWGMLQLRNTLTETPAIQLEKISDTARGILSGESDLSTKRPDKAWKPYFDGSVYRYQLHWNPSTWVRYGPNLREMPSTYHYFVGPRLLVRRLVSRQARLMATYASEEFVNTKDLYNVIITEGGYDNFAILALLNSRLFSYWYIAQSMVATRDDFPQVTLVGLRQLPIRRIDFTTPAEEREELTEQARAIAQEVVRALAATGAVGAHAPLDRATLQGSAAPVLEFVAARLAAEPEQADVVHDLLAHLAKQMIEMNKQKQATVEAFWLDLEGVTEPETFETLRNKGKWESTLHRSQACRPFVDQESRSTRHLDESLGWSEEAFKAFIKALAGRVSGLSDLVSIYRDYSSAYRDLIGRIAATDWLIDQVVYKLYGLTEEEIAIVEGRDG